MFEDFRLDTLVFYPFGGSSEAIDLQWYAVGCLLLCVDKAKASFGVNVRVLLKVHADICSEKTEVCLNRTIDKSLRIVDVFLFACFLLGQLSVDVFFHTRESSDHLKDFIVYKFHTIGVYHIVAHNATTVHCFHVAIVLE